MLESLDGGRTWADIAAALPSLDIHAFARSRLDPHTMWAYLARGGIFFRGWRMRAVAGWSGALAWSAVIVAIASVALLSQPPVMVME